MNFGEHPIVAPLVVAYWSVAIAIAGLMEMRLDIAAVAAVNALGMLALAAHSQVYGEGK